MSDGVMEDQRPLMHATQSWGVSLLGHGVAVWLALFVLGDLKFAPQEEPFRWNVSMVVPPKPTPTPESAPPPVQQTSSKPSPPQVRPIEPTPIVETNTAPIVQTVQTVQWVERREISRDVQEMQDVRQVEQVVERPVQAVSQSINAAVKAQPSPQAVAPTPAVVAAAPVVTAPPSSAVVRASQPVANPARAPVIETASIETATAAAREIVEQEIAAVTPAPSSTVVTSLQAIQEAAVRPAPAVARPGPKADYRWVGEALGERVRQLLVYPAKARLNNLTGRVVVRVVIREDGHLHDIEIVKGSGHDILDHAAIELVRRACPLKMKHALGRPQVTIMLPVVYELVG